MQMMQAVEQKFLPTAAGDILNPDTARSIPTLARSTEFKVRWKVSRSARSDLSHLAYWLTFDLKAPRLQAVLTDCVENDLALLP
jgi:hypothetical protein